MPPSVPLIRFNALVTALRTAAKHYTSRNYPPEWDLRFHIQFAILRNLLEGTGHWTIEDYQVLACRTFPPPKGMLVIPVTITPGPAESQRLESEMKQVINLLGPGLDGLEVRIEPVMAEWQGPQRILHDTHHSDHSPEEQYEELVRDTKDGPVILYFHGGAYIVGSPDTHRDLTLRIANGCNGRIFAVRYRLAPEHPFPAALLDALAAYMYLIDPPKGALHQAVDPSKIIIAGDSAGGGLSFSLITFLTNSAGGLPLPAGVIGLSPWLDLTHSFPSARDDRGLDYLPNPWTAMVQPRPSKSWPPAKPRYHFYSDIPLHPLVSPVLAEELPKCPPVLIIVGDNEYLRDESLYFAAQFAKNGGSIRLQSYTAMVHVFQMFERHPCAQTSLHEIARFIEDATSGAKIETEMRIVDGHGRMQDTPLELEKYPTTFTREELLKRMESEVERRYASMKLPRT